MLKPPFPYHLRAMRLSDIAAVMVIERAVFPMPWKASAYEYEITRNRIATYQALTASIGDQPTRLIGYCGYWMMADEQHISTIAVDSRWQSRGLGQLLLLNILFMAFDEGARLVTLEVRAGNVVAQALYRKYRFLVVGERARYYQGKEDALLMTVEPLNGTYRSFLRGQRTLLYERLQQG